MKIRAEDAQHLAFFECTANRISTKIQICDRILSYNSYFISFVITLMLLSVCVHSPLISQNSKRNIFPPTRTDQTEFDMEFIRRSENKSVFFHFLIRNRLVQFAVQVFVIADHRTEETEDYDGMVGFKIEMIAIIPNHPARNEQNQFAQCKRRRRTQIKAINSNINNIINQITS